VTKREQTAPVKQAPQDLPSAEGLRVAVLYAAFNPRVVNGLLDGACSALAEMGAEGLVREAVPGAFELPLAALAAAGSGRFDAVVALGAVIRGETDHYDHVAGSVTSGVARVGLDTGVPTIFGVLTTDTVEQALNRSGLKAGNNGYHAAVAAVEMASLLAKIGPSKG
jgi:6,7-dimethyl-8-ribityllumazine synthase